ncbi:LysR substrate-binding domain-containing protein [Hydrogenophaga sp.]|uniref:LysR family transcriptional regulator n=1 Tax=Hydrogenophaga sp. TaxID=1904254 RepID=UPI0025C51C61|nr:LysR substrate-binding domain-containing protein [Hydrogenophaga sp.]MBT9466415.1 LysR family transcriptional regulator [Hydrogenophaga sp.]
MALHFDLVDLRLMVRVAEANSLTRGAEASHLSLPAASTRVKNLEESIGTRLFWRNSQGVTLTPAGQAVVHHARMVLGQLEHLTGDLQAYTQGVKGHVRVYANTTALSEYLPPVLAAFLRSHPDVNIDLRERLSHDIIRAVTDGQTDIGIVAGSVRTENLETKPYRQDHLVLVLPRDHELAVEAAVPFERTLDYLHVGLHEASAIHAFLRQACERLSRTLQLRIQVSSFEVACRLIEEGVGVGVLPASAARRHARHMALHIVPLSDAWSLRAMQICVRNFDTLPVFARDLVDLLTEDAQAASAAADQAPDAAR